MSRINLTGKRVLVTLPLDERQKDEFTAIIEGAGGVASFIREPLVKREDVANVSVIIGNVPATKLRPSEVLDWFQTSSAGYDHYLAAGCLADRTVLTCASGTYGQAVSEHMFAQLICLMKKLHLYRDNQREGLWHDEGTVTTLAGASVLVIGAGDIGTCFARLCHAMGAHVTGMRRSNVPCVEPYECMATMDELANLLHEADVVACVLPSTPDTRCLANAEFFAQMKEGSYFVNGGRGDLVVANALVEALASGHLAGAALDVTKPEPLPTNHPLWQQPNALITPHIAGFWHLPAQTRKTVALCRDNLVAYLEGRELANLVDH